MINQKRGLILATVLIAIMALGIVSASGVSGPYWDSNPLMLGKGESVVVPLVIQNNVGSNEITMKVAITSGANIASISKTTYTVPPQGSVTVPVTIRLPSDAIVGDSRPIALTFTEATSGDAGMVSIGTASNWAFNVVVTQPKNKPVDYTLWIGLLVLLIAIVIIAILIRRAKPKKKSGSKR